MKPKIAKSKFLLISALVLGLGSSAHSSEVETQLKNPFALTQTTFFFGNAAHSLTISDASTRVKADGITNYGFEIEVNQNSFMNIGAFFRIENLTAQVGSDTSPLRQTYNPSEMSLFSSTLGGFTRFYYAPQFLNWGAIRSSFFLRLDLGGGPAFLNAYGSMLAQGGASLGVETFFTKWLGMNLSYGQHIAFGRITTDKAGLNYSLQGSSVFVGIKTTFF